MTDGVSSRKITQSLACGIPWRFHTGLKHGNKKGGVSYLPPSLSLSSLETCSNTKSWDNPSPTEWSFLNFPLSSIPQTHAQDNTVCSGTQLPPTKPTRTWVRDPLCPGISVCKELTLHFPHCKCTRNPGSQKEEHCSNALEIQVVKRRKSR